MTKYTSVILALLLALVSCTPLPVATPTIATGQFAAERITVDPPFAVAASGDDVVTLSTSSTFSSTSSSCTAGNSAGATYNTAMRFSLPIPRGSTILTATVTFYASFNQAGTTCNTNLYFESADNAAAITSYNDYGGRSVGDAVAWASIPAWTAGTTYTSPDMAAILGVVIARPGWAISNYVNLFWKNNSSSTNAWRMGASWDNTTYTEPVLTVTWTSPARGPWGFVF